MKLIEAAFEVDLGDPVKRPAVVNVYALASGGVELVEFAGEQHRSRPFTFQAAQGLAGFEVDNLDGPVGGSSREPPLPSSVHRHVIEASLNIGQGNCVEE